MQRFFVVFSFLAALLLANTLFVPSAMAADDEAVKELKANPNDAGLLLKYLQKTLGHINGLINSDPDAAEKEIAALSKLLSELEPEDAKAKNFVSQGKSVVKRFEGQLELARIKIEDLEANLKKDADDAKSVDQYIAKVMQLVGSNAMRDPKLAESKLKAAKELLANVSEKTTDDNVKAAIARSDRGFGQLQGRVASGKKLADLVGKDAAELKIKDWSNGSPLTDADLKGKVVLLDFWAVWCGPCIATFPHLREWHDKYNEEGLVIIGLTRYYNYTWDDEAERGVRSTEEVSPEDERKMLDKFAKHHNLEHRFAIQDDESSLADYYGVGGIPHVVVVNRAGKIEVIRVGSGEQNAKDVEAAIKKSLAAK